MNYELLVNCLEEAGVNNWTGYGDALADYKNRVKYQAIEDDFSDLVSDIFCDCTIEGDDYSADIVYDGDIQKLYTTMKDFINKIELNSK